MTVQVYHSGMAGAPANYSTAAGGQVQFTNLKTVLIACLVTGFGAVQGAGWELIAQGSNYLVLRNGSHTGYIGLTWVAGGVVRIYLSPVYNGVDANGYLLGGGRRTGSGAIHQALGLSFFTHSATTSSWYCLADEKTFVFGLVGNTFAEEVGSSVSSSYTTCLYAGEDSQGNFISVGGEISDATGGGGVRSHWGARGGFTSFKDPSTGLLVGSGTLTPIFTGVSSPGTGAALPNDSYSLASQIRSVSFAPVSWYVGAHYCGDLRGVAVSPELYACRHASDAARALTGLPLMTGAIYRALDVGDGHNYFARPGSSPTSMFFATDNPGFW